MATQAGDPRGTQAWKSLRERVFAEETHCWWCKGYVDQTLHRYHRKGRTADHIDPLYKGGAGIPPRDMVRLMHRGCNAARSNRERAKKPRQELSIDACLI